MNPAQLDSRRAVTIAMLLSDAVRASEITLTELLVDSAATRDVIVEICDQMGWASTTAQIEAARAEAELLAQEQDDERG